MQVFTVINDLANICVKNGHGSIVKRSICEEASRTFAAPSGGRGGTPLYGLYRYVRPQRVWFFQPFWSLNVSILADFGLVFDFTYMSVSSSVSMMSRFPNGLVLVVVLSLGLTTSYKIDDPFPSEWEKDTMQEMTDEMNRLDKLNHEKKDEEQAKRVAPSGSGDNLLVNKAAEFANDCMLETDNKIPEKEITEKREAYMRALRKHYQALQHGKGSIASDESWLAARRSEVCGACVLVKLCDSPDVLSYLGIDPNLGR